MHKPKAPTKPQVPLGKPLHLNDEDLDRLSEVTPEDIERLKEELKKISPKLSALLDAKVIKGTKKKGHEKSS